MAFSDCLNGYLAQLGCAGKELARASGLSASVISRYRSGERVPAADGEAFNKVVEGIVALADEKHMPLAPSLVYASLWESLGTRLADARKLAQRLNLLIPALSLNISDLARFLNYDPSYISHIRTGKRTPANPADFARRVSDFVGQHCSGEDERRILAGLLDTDSESLDCAAKRAECLEHWLCAEEAYCDRGIAVFLEKISAFNLAEYVEARHLDALKVPAAAFQLPKTKTYTGLKAMREGELDFLKATVLSRSQEAVTIHSDMPMEDMAEDRAFMENWMTGLAMVLKKGLRINIIHNLDRPRQEMLLGLESWIPLYMTGQIAPYYFAQRISGPYRHMSCVSGAVALTGECITGHHAQGRYTLSKQKDAVAYGRRRAQWLLEKARPLMAIYRVEQAAAFDTFMAADALQGGERRGMLAAPPLYTFEAETLEALLAAGGMAPEKRRAVQATAARERENALAILKGGSITYAIPRYPRERVEQGSICLPLADCFFEEDVFYTPEAYEAHLRQTRAFAGAHPGFSVTVGARKTFANLQIRIRSGKWAMVSKLKYPAIHFVITHPYLLAAIEDLVSSLSEIEGGGG
jgi:hypothetical protein